MGRTTFDCILGILKNISPLPPSSPAAVVDLDRTVIIPLFVPLLGVDLIAASTTVYNIASKPVRPHDYIRSYLRFCYLSSVLLKLNIILSSFNSSTRALSVVFSPHHHCHPYLSIPPFVRCLFPSRRIPSRPNSDTLQNQTTRQRTKKNLNGLRLSC